MVKKVTITLPDDLSERLDAVKKTFNVSGVCQEAVRQEVARQEILSKTKNKKMKPVVHKFKLSKEAQEIVNQLKDPKQKKFCIDNFRRSWEWEHSLEGISYNLDSSMCVTSDDLMVLVVKLLLRVPDKIRDFVYRNCRFSSMCNTAVYRDLEEFKRCPWHIFLYEEYSDRIDYQSVIAQQIAHAYLGHNKKGGFMPPEIEEALKYEKEACALVKKWGFVGIGAEIDEQLIKWVEQKKQRQRQTAKKQCKKTAKKK